MFLNLILIFSILVTSIILIRYNIFPSIHNFLGLLYIDVWFFLIGLLVISIIYVNLLIKFDFKNRLSFLKTKIDIVKELHKLKIVKKI